MTVRELIELLNNVPQNSVVVVYGYESGYDNPVFGNEDIILDTNWDGKNKVNWFEGRHDRYYHGIESDTVEPVNAIVIGRGK